MRELLVLLALLTPDVQAFAQVHPSAWLCVAGCRRSVDFVVFDVPKKIQGTCHDLYASSLFACVADYCTQHEAKVGFPSINKTFCIDYGTPLPTYDFTAIHGLSSDNVTLVSYPDGIEDRNYTNTVVPDQDFFQLGYDTEEASNTAMTFNWATAMGNIGFWALVLLVASSHHQISLLRPSTQKVRDRDNGLEPVVAKNTRLWLKRHLLFTQPVAGSNLMIPNRFEFLLVATYALMNFIFCFLGYHYMKVSLLDWHAVQYERYIANRCGFLVLSNLPIIWLFSTRNNPFIWLTNWSFDTFNYFHKWIARFVALLAIVHGTCYTTGDSLQGIYIKSFKKDLWYRCGIFGLTTICFMIIFSSRYFRKLGYDLFLVIHIGMAVVVLALIKQHLTVWKGRIRENVWAFIWTCIAFWAFDRLLRLIRIFHPILLRGRQATKTIATYEQDAGIIRLDVTTLFRDKSYPRPGSHYYIYEPGAWRGYENHPFSLCSWKQSSTDNAAHQSTTPPYQDETSKPEPTVVDVTEDIPTDNKTTPSTSDSDPIERHTFLMRPQAGWTKRLQQKLSSKATTSAHLTLLHEGPYGHLLPLENHSDIVMIIGGIGIAAAISHIYRLLQTSPQPSLRLIWVARTQSFFENILQNELAHLIRHCDARVRLDMYLTSGPASPEKESGSSDSGLLSSGFHHGRPDLEQEISTARSDAVRDLAVFCCGPAAMGQACRDSVSRLSRGKGVEISLYFEVFTR